MKTLLTLSLALLTTGAFSQVIFSEDFNNSVGMPAGFTMINNDGLTPATNVAYVNDAWINRVDFVLPSLTDSCAFSTSWYTPAGTSDDWMITPIIAVSAGATTVALDWEAMAPDAAYLDGYEVWVSTGAPTIAGMTGGTMVFSTPAADNVWTAKNVDISAFAGSSIYVGFRNNSTDKFLLMVDSIYVTENAVAAPDAAMLAEVHEYTQVPLTQVTLIGASGTIDNVGTADVTNAVMTVNVYDGTMANVYTASSAPQNILLGANALATVAGYTPLVDDLYTVEQIVSITEADVDNNNDTSYYQVLVTPFTYARDDGNIANLLGVGVGATAVVGQNFELIAAETMSSVTFLIAPGAPSLGDTVSVSIYDVVAGAPTTIIGQSVEYIMTPADTTGAGALLTLNVSDLGFAPLALGVGTYFVGINEYNAMDNMAIGFSTDILTPNTAWISINGGAFATSEALGFAGAYVIRPNFDSSCTPSVAAVTATSCGDYTAPSGAVFTTTGVHTDIIPNSCGADSVITITLTITPLDLGVTVAGNTITSDQGGAATYQWIDCATLTDVAGETSQSYTGTAAGSFAVVVTNGACSDTSACTSLTIGLNELAANGQLEVYPNPSNGQFTINIKGITTDAMSIEVVDFSGRVVGSKTYNNVQGQLSAAMNVNVEAGSYLVRISANGESTVQTIVISK
ncbi:MAG: hypothetical protein ACI837_001723 [Crocinitomicaceae bacterium]|jgi:hypothetical protein